METGVKKRNFTPVILKWTKKCICLRFMYLDREGAEAPTDAFLPYITRQNESRKKSGT